MAQRFFTDTVQSRFIQQFLSNIPFPNLKTINPQDYLIEGKEYLFKEFVLRCTSSGYVTGSSLYPADDLYPSEDQYALKNTATYERVQLFQFGLQDPLLTFKPTFKNHFYDQDTHRFLGEYLRIVRDLFRIDLMPFYNCFNYTQINHFSLQSSSTPSSLSSSEDFALRSKEGYICYGVPIKFRKNYKIYIECPVPIQIKPIIWNSFGLLKESVVSDTYLTEYLPKTTHYLNSSFQTPIKYSVPNENPRIEKYEKHLYLAIQIPSSLKSSIVVLEEDSDLNYPTYLNAEVLDPSSFFYRDPDETQQKIDALLISRKSLTQFNDGQIYAFSDRLIEFLLGNVITEFDEIYQDVQRIQAAILKQHSHTPEMIDSRQMSGVWTNSLRNDCFQRTMQQKPTLLDVTGFVDKSVEGSLQKKLKVRY